MAVVRTGFSHRRKMMIKNLKGRWPEARLLAVLEELSLSPKIRAEEVTREQYVELARRLAAA